MKLLLSTAALLILHSCAITTPYGTASSDGKTVTVNAPGYGSGTFDLPAKKGLVK